MTTGLWNDTSDKLDFEDNASDNWDFRRHQ